MSRADGQTDRPPRRPIFATIVSKARILDTAASRCFLGDESSLLLISVEVHCYYLMSDTKSRAKRKESMSREGCNVPYSTALQSTDAVSFPIMTSQIALPAPSLASGTNDESLAILSGVASEMTKLSERDAKRKASIENGLVAPTSKQARSPKGHLRPPPENTDEVLRQRISPNVRIIQDWHAVIGDKHSGNRTTAATKIFKDVKQWYKQNKVNYRGQSRQRDLLSDAMKMYFQLVSEEFPRDFPTEESERMDTILIHCSSKASESNRVLVPRCFRYERDTEARYGIANIPTAVIFFFESRDAPTLEYDVSKYRREIGDLLLRAPADRTTHKDVLYFQGLLDFCEQQMEIAKDQDTARQFLDLINLRTTLKQLWQKLKGPSDSEDTVHSKSLQSS